jgi:alanyl-tRNA synthetase
MNEISSKHLRNLFYEYFGSKYHKILPSFSLIPKDDNSVLFTNSGMHPLMKYLAGEDFPGGNRLANIQKVIRTKTLDLIGEPYFVSFFEGLGNWSLGDYDKKEAIEYIYQFLTAEDYLALDKDKLYFTCFMGNQELEMDEESYKSWLNLGIDSSHIHLTGKNTKGPYGKYGLYGTNTKVFYDIGRAFCKDECNPTCGCGKYFEIWDIVSFECSKLDSPCLEPLPRKVIDTGNSLDRLLAFINGANSIYDTDLFRNVIVKIKQLTRKTYETNEREFRIIADHMRAATFILGDENAVVPSNKDQGYILRRFIRRSMMTLRKLGLQGSAISDISATVIETYGEAYPELMENKGFIQFELAKEEETFLKSLEKGLKTVEKEFNTMIAEKVLSAEKAFMFYERYGFPIELTIELAAERNIAVDMEGYAARYQEHQLRSKK